MAIVKFSNGNTRNGLNPLFNDVFGTFFNESFVSDRLISRVPPVNIAETDNGYDIELAAPGLTKEDFKINLDKNILSISAEKKSEKTENKKYNSREYSYSSFARSFTIPEMADQSKIEAEYVNGLLKVNVAKREEAKNITKEISIK
jgi:HSP20 family protein